MEQQAGDRRRGVSGRRVIVYIAIGLTVVAVITYSLYFATRRLDYNPDATPTPGFRSPIATLLSAAG